MDEFGIVIGAVEVDTVAGGAGIMRQIAIKPHVARHAGCRLNAEIGEIPRDDQTGDTGAAQLQVKVGADETGIDRFFDDDVAGFGFEPCKLRAAVQGEFQRAVGFKAVVAGEGNGQAC